MPFIEASRRGYSPRRRTARVDEGVELSPQLWKFRHIRKFDIAIADRVEASAILKKPRIVALLRNRSRHENSRFSLARNTLYQTARAKWGKAGETRFGYAP
ncbi:MAG: hypothetical protein WCA59_11065 [Candidatus Binataceae bacterium]